MSLYEHEVSGQEEAHENLIITGKTDKVLQNSGWGYCVFFVSTGRHQCLHSYANEVGTASLKCGITLTLKSVRAWWRRAVTDARCPRTLCKIMLPCPHKSLWRHMIHLKYQHETNQRRHGYESYRILNGQKWKEGFERSAVLPMVSDKSVTDARWTCPERNEKPLFILTTKRVLGKAMEQADDVWHQCTETAFEAIPFQ